MGIRVKIRLTRELYSRYGNHDQPGYMLVNKTPIAIACRHALIEQTLIKCTMVCDCGDKIEVRRAHRVSYTAVVPKGLRGSVGKTFELDFEKCK